MACGATLKRSLDFDPLMSPASPKRRRCAPVMSPVSSPQKYLRMEPSPFGEVSSRLTTGKKWCLRLISRLSSFLYLYRAILTSISSGVYDVTLQTRLCKVKTSIVIFSAACGGNFVITSTSIELLWLYEEILFGINVRGGGDSKRIILQFNWLIDLMYLSTVGIYIKIMPRPYFMIISEYCSDSVSIQSQHLYVKISFNAASVCFRANSTQH